MCPLHWWILAPEALKLVIYGWWEDELEMLSDKSLCILLSYGQWDQVVYCKGRSWQSDSERPDPKSESEMQQAISSVSSSVVVIRDGRNKKSIYKVGRTYQEFKKLAISLPFWVLYSTEHTRLKTLSSPSFQLELEKENPSHSPNAHWEKFFKLEINSLVGTKTPWTAFDKSLLSYWCVCNVPRKDRGWSV